MSEVDNLEFLMPNGFIPLAGTNGGALWVKTADENIYYYGGNEADPPLRLYAQDIEDLAQKIEIEKYDV